MNRIRLTTIFLIFSIFSVSSLGGGRHDEVIYAKIFDDKYACDNSLPVIVVAPEAMKNHRFMSAIFFLKNGDRYFQSSLQYSEDLDGEGGFFFCLDEHSLEYASLVLNYGYDQCRGFIHSFRVENFDKILTEKKVFIQSPSSDQTKTVSKCGRAKEIE